MLYRLLLVVSLVSLTACASGDAEPTGDVPAYDAEPAPTAPAAPTVTDADPAPIYEDAATPTPDAGTPHVLPSHPRDASTPDPMPAADASTPDATPSTPDAAPTPTATPTSCKLSNDVVLTCANQHVYGYDLYWSIGSSLTSYNCNVTDAVQCKRGDTCGAALVDGTTLSGVCQ
jgi:hypothetical protein